VREDPVRKGLLFAGTERAVHVSFDDGESWQPLRLNMPATSIRDLVIKGDDLVVGTHGRSFWILDDITPLRQTTADTFGGTAHLFTPQQAWRFRWNKNTDTPLPPDEPAGENPPDGAILDYWLKQDASQLTLEIVDGKDAVVRRYSSADPAETFVEGRNTPDYWLRPHQPLAAKAGFHRFVWDLRHERPAVTSFTYPIAAIAGRTPRVPLGSWIPPGQYTVRLTVDGKSLTQPLTVKMDPRVKATAAEVSLQYETSRAIDAALRQIAARLTQTPANREVLVRVQGQLTQLFGIVEQSDAAPASQVLSAVKETLAAANAALK
jgi:hypothetical protein